MKKTVSSIIKLLTIISSFAGIFIASFFANKHGYSHWARRLLYFTTQSNLWIGITFLGVLFTKLLRCRPKIVNFIYLLKYIFTVSITVTACVFWFFLAPFADESYHVWSLSSILTHVVVPFLAIADFFIDDYPLVLKRRHVFFSIIPPALYTIFVSILFYLNVDFGRGEPFPYFFFNYRSQVGFFGFGNVAPYFMGSFYWILLLAILNLCLAIVYKRFHTARLTVNEKIKKEKAYIRNTKNFAK